MDINDYANVFWGKNSLNFSFEELGIWDSKKYWRLELYLINLCKELDKKQISKKTLQRTSSS